MTLADATAPSGGIHTQAGRQPGPAATPFSCGCTTATASVFPVPLTVKWPLVTTKIALRTPTDGSCTLPGCCRNVQVDGRQAVSRGKLSGRRHRSRTINWQEGKFVDRGQLRFGGRPAFATTQYPAIQTEPPQLMASFGPQIGHNSHVFRYPWSGRLHWARGHATGVVHYDGLAGFRLASVMRSRLAGRAASRSSVRSSSSWRRSRTCCSSWPTRVRSASESSGRPIPPARKTSSPRASESPGRELGVLPAEPLVLLAEVGEIGQQGLPAGRRGSGAAGWIGEPRGSEPGDRGAGRGTTGRRRPPWRRLTC